jgi:D-alanine-D-alanine ligase
MKIGVLMGGDSSEREVSLKSGKAIVNACKKLKHEVAEFDPKEGFDSLSLEIKNVDLVFNALHGGDGENGVISSKLDSLGVKYTGSDELASAICINKDKSKKIVKKENYSTPDWIMIKKDDEIPDVNNFSFPLVVKPNSEGSTIGLAIIQEESKLIEAIQLARTYGENVLVESFIDGREITVGIIAGESYPIVEVFPSHELYDYECKYTKGMTHYICPAKMDMKLSQKIKKIALDIHELLKCRHYSRVDFRLDRYNKPWFLELNTHPGMTETSLLPKSAAAVGIDFNSLINKIIKQAF